MENAEDGFVGGGFEGLVFVAEVEAALFGFEFGDAGFDEALEFARRRSFGWEMNDVRHSSQAFGGWVRGRRCDWRRGCGVRVCVCVVARVGRVGVLSFSLCLHGCPFSPTDRRLVSFAVRPRPTGRT